MPKLGEVNVRKMNPAGNQPLYSGRIEVISRTSVRVAERFTGTWNNILRTPYTPLGTRGWQQRRWLINPASGGLFRIGFYQATSVRGAFAEELVLTIDGIPPGRFTTGGTGTGYLRRSHNAQFRGNINYILI